MLITHLIQMEKTFANFRRILEKQVFSAIDKVNFRL